MDAKFWHERWANNQIAFHEPAANRLLLAHFAALGMPRQSRIFLPLCGKTLDIHWLLGNGYQVVGAELSKTAVEQLFSELGVEPNVTIEGKVRRYRADGIDILNGDIFDLSRDTLGPVDAIYDRAALVALPAPTRERYARHLIEISGRAPQLLITFDYDQSRIDGPPFSVNAAEVARQYGSRYEVNLLASVELEGGLKKKVPAREEVWLLR